ncbi:MAG: hypothetical protein FJ039_07030 [Chloroflexi bacterium]|nr:hypothetical protein [Chloroflexota bacterium]
MGLRTPAHYIKSLNDGRAVYYKGKKVADVTKHPFLRIAVEHAAIDYHLAEDPKHKELAVVKDPETGNPISRLYLPPKTTADLLKRSELIALATREGKTMVTLIKEIGTDALFALHIVSRQMDKALGTHFYERVHRFYRHCADNDLAVAVAQTDAKGDRVLRPSEQEHPDYYLRVVERRKDGIVVRGAKLHTSVSVNSNELIVLPTRNFDEKDKDYAVAFAIPMNTKGLRLITSAYSQPKENDFQFPLSNKHLMLETTTIFDDVFVPNERIFMDGQYQFAGPLALAFVDFHRFTAVSYKQPLLDLLVGAGLLLADQNGISRVSHVRDKLTWLATYTETVKGLLGYAAVTAKTVEPGFAVPNRMYSNVAKFQFAHNYHQALAIVQDIAGGLVVTAPGEEDMKNATLAKDIRRYLGGRKGVSAEDRLKAMHLVADLTATEFGGYHAVLAIHAEGSLEAEKLAIQREYDIASALAYAKRMANIK